MLSLALVCLRARMPYHTTVLGVFLFGIEVVEPWFTVTRVVLESVLVCVCGALFMHHSAGAPPLLPAHMWG